MMMMIIITNHLSAVDKFPLSRSDVQGLKGH